VVEHEKLSRSRERCWKSSREPRPHIRKSKPHNIETIMAIKYLHLGDYEIREVAIEIQVGQGGQDLCCDGKNGMKFSCYIYQNPEYIKF
jgi:hypothetical protein